jgi:multisubunit Na+/H+ antiporter MnhB subunit
MDQHFKNILAIIIAFASAMTFLVVVVRLRDRAADTERPRTGRYSLDGAGRRVAVGCSFVAAALAGFWLMRRLRGPVPKWSAFLVDFFIFYSSLGALGFGLVGIRRELSKLTISAPLTFTVLSVMWAFGLALESYIHGAPDLGRAGLVTFAVTIGLALGYSVVGKRLRPGSAQAVR